MNDFISFFFLGRTAAQVQNAANRTTAPHLRDHAGVLACSSINQSIIAATLPISDSPSSSMAQTDDQFFQQQQSAPPIITEPSADGAEMAPNDAESLAATGTFLSFYANFRRFHHNAQQTTKSAL